MRIPSLAALAIGLLVLGTAQPALAICGDGTLDADESCDDGNLVSDDGCGYACYAEVGYTCDVPGSPCDAICACWLRIADDFADNLPNLSTWDYLTAFHPGASVSDSDGALVLTNGAWVASEQTLEPVAEGGLRIHAKWQIGADDEVSIMTRSNLALGTDGYPQTAGARYTASEANDTVTLILPGEAPQTVAFTIEPDDELWFDITESDGNTVGVVINWPAGGTVPGAGPAPSVRLSSASPAAPLTSNHIVFANAASADGDTTRSSLAEVHVSSLNAWPCKSFTCPTDPAVCETNNFAIDTGCDDLDDETGGDVCDGLGACAGVLVTCGDGVLDPREACDDGVDNSDLDPNACRSNCRDAYCGDDVVDTGEQCDDGLGNDNALPNACRTNCRNAACGDGTIDDGEVCDDDNTRGGDGCSNTCSVVETGWYCDLTPCYTVCGDDLRAGSEACDNGGLNSDSEADACRTNCLLARCGDTTIDTNEECDDGLGNSNTLPDTCRSDCTLPGCGDGVVDGGEVCDDGGQLDGDGCGADCASWEEGWDCDADGACLSVCGDGVVVGEEECDDGYLNGDLPDGCRTNCRAAYCGDGIVDSQEPCDDGNSDNDDGCLNRCIAPTCGDGYLFGVNEQCDDGELNDDSTPDACRSDCSRAGCGDGVIDGAEDCDDGNRASNDGCSSTCEVEEEATGGSGGTGGTGGDDGDEPGGCAATRSHGASAGLMALVVLAAARLRRRRASR